MELLILNDQNTENGEMPQLTEEIKKRVKTVRVLNNSNLNCIPEGAFSRWSSLESVHIEDGANENITTINRYAFAYCSSLKSVNIPFGVTTIGRSAFACCSSLQSVNIPSGGVLTTIEQYAFWSCTSLQSFHIPNTVVGEISIADNALDGCDKLHRRQRNNGPNSYHPCTITWLRRRFDNLPIHHACYDATNTKSTTVDDLLSRLVQQNKQALAATDAMGMTPLDILSCNPRATIEMAQILVENDPSLLPTGLSPFMLAASFSVCGLDVVYALAMNGGFTIVTIL